jgi:Spy/CpxP family protein refolding chaperone
MRIFITAMTLIGATWICAALHADTQGQVKGVVMLEVIQDLHLTDEQEAKIADIHKAFQPRIQQAAKEIAALGKEVHERIQGVLTSDQLVKLEEFKEERKEIRGERLSERIAHLHELDLTEGEETKILAIRKEFHPKIEKAMSELHGVLTDAQKKTRAEDLKAGMKRQDMLAALKLTDDQKTKVEKVGKEVRALVREEIEKIRDLLTDSQKEKLQEFKGERREAVRDRMAHRIANAKELNLTDAQKSQIADIRMAYRPKIHEAGNKYRAAVREEVDAIVAVLK